MWPPAAPPPAGAPWTAPTAPPPHGDSWPPSPEAWTPPPPRRQPNADGFAIAALLTGIVSVVLFFLLLPAVVALVLAVIGASRIKRGAGLRTGRALAVTGGVLGGLSLIGGTALIAFVVSNGLVGAHLVRYSALQTGDCFDLPSTLGFYRTYPCDHGHDAEVYGKITDPSAQGAPYPGHPALSQEARTTCPAQFQRYLIVPVDGRRYRAQYLYPLATSWDNGERSILCIVRALDGAKLHASIRGAATA